SEREKAEVDRLVAVYTAMRPREAARVFANLNDDVRLPVAAAMRPRSLAAVMAQMEPAAARELTEKFAGRFAAQRQLAARAAAAEAPSAPEAPRVVETASAVPPPAAPPPAPRPAARRPAARSQPRPAATTAQPAPAVAEPAGERPYQP